MKSCSISMGMFQLEQITNRAKERWTKEGLAQCLRRWIPEPGVPSSKLLGGSKMGHIVFFLIFHKYNNTRWNPTPQAYSNYEGIVVLQIILLHITLTKRELAGCVHYIFASLFLSLNESTDETGENVFYFTSKALFILVKIKFQNFRYSSFMTSSNAKA